ncbi:MAG: cysteine desulfurase family protein [Bacilli bacterium]|nr:cysteine desulfurase family protein [Bacilli bacterium]
MKKNYIYLDYSATTKPEKKVLNYFCNISEKNYANPNSQHILGKNSHQIIDKATKIISKYLNIETDEIIYTSGASEANNTVFKGLANDNRKHIITSPLEHSSIYGPIGYLQKKGYKISIAPLNDDGTININELEKLITKDTFLISIAAVDSELGTRQPIEEIGKMLKKYPNIYFHSDITQCIGKDIISLENIDLASFSGHKIFCFKGIGGLIKKRNIKLTPLIHGGKSVTKYRSGTPQTALIGSLGKSFTLFKNDLPKKQAYVKELNNRIRNHIKKYNQIKINSTNMAIPNVLNISFLGKKPDKIQKYFQDNKIIISTKTACSNDEGLSKSVYSITKDEERAKSSVRISLSYKTTIKEVDYLLKIIDKLIGEYNEIN